MKRTLKKLVKQARYTSDLAAGLPALRRPGAMAYVGWSGNGNLGDDAMLAAHRHLMPAVTFTQLPNRPAGRLLPVALRSVDALCLGGGTLILNGHFRETWQGAASAAPGTPRVMLSVGVEDLGFVSGRRANVREEATRWAPLLAEFDVLRVRGPLSQQTLATLGFDSIVVGDPALAFPAQHAAVEPADRIGVNVGITDDLWGDDQTGFRRTIMRTIQALHGKGIEIQLLATTAEDVGHLRELATELAAAGVPTLGPNEATLPELDRALAGCKVVVGEKLHALVLAARLGVPTIALEYRPKCRDFQASVGREQATVRTDTVDAEELVRMSTAVLDAHEHESRLLRAAVGEQVESLRAAAAAVLAATTTR